MEDCRQGFLTVTNHHARFAMQRDTFGPDFIVQAKVWFIRLNRVIFARGALPMVETSCAFCALDASLDLGTPFASPQLGTILPLPR